MADGGAQTMEELQERFGIPEVLEFRMRGELICLEMRTPGVRAAVSLQGAHVLEWQPEGTRPALFLSGRSEWVAGRPIRGGVPVIWPWFGPRTDVVNAAPEGAGKSPAHGFARTEVWRLDFAAVAGEDVHLSFSLDPTEASRAWGFDEFRVIYRMVLGREMRARLTVVNEGEGPLRYEEALHTYFGVEDAAAVRVRGLAGTAYLDKRDGMARKVEGEGALRLCGATDRVYLQTETPCEVVDGDRVVRLEKANSGGTVVWNPWTELTPGLPDMDPDGWQRMVCVETVNVGEGAIRIEPGESHAMGMHVRVERNETGAAVEEDRPC